MSDNNEFLKTTIIDDDELKSLIEALLFAAAEPLALSNICQICDMSQARVMDILALLEEKYAAKDSGLQLRSVEDKYYLATKSQWQEYLARLFRPEHRPALSNAAYEVLACIAYNQPCTRAQIEQVRGVNSDTLVSRLLERGLIEETGQLDLPGRPAVFSVTEHFLQEFGLKSVDDLPTQEMLMYDILNQLS